MAITLAPFIVAVAILLFHNKLYFGNILSSGYDIHDKQDTVHFQYGILSWHYIWPNFVVDFLRWSSFSFTGINDVHPRPDLYIDGIGTSMFFSTPLLAIFLFAPQGKTPQSWLRSTLWVTLAILLLSILCFEAAGASQVGARYILPIYPLLFLLLAQRAAPLDTRWICLAGLSIFIKLLLAKVFWTRNLGKFFIAGSASIVLVACVITLVMLYRQRRQQEKNAPLAPPTIPAEPTSGDKATAKEPKLNREVQIS